MLGAKNKISLSEQAYQKIRNLIISLRLKPGLQVNEGDLEKELSIGRTPVREAILRLVTEGFLISLPGRGFFVRQVSLEDVRALFEAVMILERAAVALAAKRILPNQLKQLEEINRDLECTMANQEFLQVTLLNSKFHRIVHNAIHNDLLISSLHSLESQYQRLAFLCFSKDAQENNLKAHFAKVIADHNKLIECFRARDDIGAVETMTRHVHLFHSRVSQYLYPKMQTLDAAHVPFQMSS